MKLSRKLSFKTAWAYFKNNNFETFAEALKAAWTKFKIKARLQADKLTFKFRKQNGEIRTASGTLNNNYFSYTPQNSSKKSPNPLLVHYWDFDKSAFRCFRIDRLISF